MRIQEARLPSTKVNMLSKKAHMKRIVTELSLEGYTIPAIAEELEERGITNANGTRVSKKKVSGILKSVGEQWKRETRENVDLTLAKQQAEIQHIKRKLHEEGDYKTLLRYMEHEHKLVTPKQRVQHIDTQNNLFVSAAERIQALQLASESEIEIEAQEYEVLDGEYVEEAR